jgi:hypothetical protein
MKKKQKIFILFFKYLYFKSIISRAIDHNSHTWIGMTMDGSVECHNPSFYHCSVQVLFLLQKDFDHLDKVISLLYCMKKKQKIFILFFKYLYFKSIISRAIDHNSIFKNSFRWKYNIEMVTLVIDKLSFLILKIIHFLLKLLTSRNPCRNGHCMYGNLAYLRISILLIAKIACRNSQ